MDDETRYTLKEAHTLFAPIINQEVWELLGKEYRSREEDERMVYAAYASGYHWLHAGTPLHHQRAEWMISHVLAMTGQAEAALFHARRCLDLTELHADLMKDFDRAYGFEAMARALAMCGQQEETQRYRSLAEEAGQAIQNEEDRSFFLQDFERKRSG